MSEIKRFRLNKESNKINEALTKALKLPNVTGADVGKTLVVKNDGTFELGNGSSGGSGSGTTRYLHDIHFVIPDAQICSESYFFNKKIINSNQTEISAGDFVSSIQGQYDRNENPRILLLHNTEVGSGIYAYQYITLSYNSEAEEYYLEGPWSDPLLFNENAISSYYIDEVIEL